MPTSEIIFLAVMLLVTVAVLYFDNKNPGGVATFIKEMMIIIGTIAFSLGSCT